MTLTRRDVILAVVAAFVAWGFLTHWLPLLRFLGYAFTTGFFTALVVGALVLLSSSRPDWAAKSRKSWSHSAAFVRPEVWLSDTNWFYLKTSAKRRPILGSSSLAEESLDELVDWILRDFVASWYGNISASPAFINEIDNAIRDVLVKVVNRLRTLDLVELAILRFVPIVTNHLRDFYEA